MSNYYFLHCPSCNEDSVSENHAKDKFIALLKFIPFLKMAKKLNLTLNGFDDGRFSYSSYEFQEVIRFVMNHCDCDVIEIHSEYSESLHTEYPVISVQIPHE